jgi:hypothetical protein
MKFILLEEGGEIEAYEVLFLPWDELDPEQQEKSLQAWVPDPMGPMQ